MYNGRQNVRGLRRPRRKTAIQLECALFDGRHLTKDTTALESGLQDTHGVGSIMCARNVYQLGLCSDWLIYHNSCNRGNGISDVLGQQYHTQRELENRLLVGFGVLFGIWNRPFYSRGSWCVSWTFDASRYLYNISIFRFFSNFLIFLTKKLPILGRNHHDPVVGDGDLCAN